MRLSRCHAGTLREFFREPLRELIFANRKGSITAATVCRGYCRQRGYDIFTAEFPACCDTSRAAVTTRKIEYNRVIQIFSRVTLYGPLEVWKKAGIFGPMADDLAQALNNAARLVDSF